MPRYFFDFFDGRNRVADPEGQLCPDADAAWDIAGRIATDLMRDRSGAADWLSCILEVRDSAGDIVLELPFVEVLNGQGSPEEGPGRD